ncbi:hypothetical protein OJAV_G00125100 [Oryzias javanicus]|uniref:CD3 gamma/delta subunit Ig-like domain-containing protein n=1 Tax=Oryzias javanicus TaxID=123683 RepID=A0A437CPQ3_ORYJA|nr:hypothetical protein OJAV_G00125100 [Oryzias javanicus]
MNTLKKSNLLWRSAELKTSQSHKLPPIHTHTHRSELIHTRRFYSRLTPTSDLQEFEQKTKMTFQLLLLWTLAALVHFESVSPDITVEEYTNGIKLICKGGSIKKDGIEVNETKELSYKDENSGEYQCETLGTAEKAESKIYVKFRTCDNCVEFDVTSIVSILVGNVVATAGIGVAVYLVASQTRTGQGSSNKKKRSDKQNLVRNEQRATDSDYQTLNHGRKDEYDLLQRR